MQDSDPIAGRLTDGGHELRQRVYFEDTDFSGRVYHARYLQFLERGRSDYLRLLGIHHRELAEDGLSFAVSRMEIDFRRPATIDDLLTIGTDDSAPSPARGSCCVRRFFETRSRLSRQRSRSPSSGLEVGRFACRGEIRALLFRPGQTV